MKVKVTQKENEKEVPTEVIAAAIVQIGEGVRKIRAGRLNDKALHLLIQHAAPTFGSYPPRKVGISDVKAVLAGLESLEATFLKKTKTQ